MYIMYILIYTKQFMLYITICVNDNNIYIFINIYHTN